MVLVGLQFAREMVRDPHYVEIRETLRRVAAQENVIVIRFFEAMQIINQVQSAARARGGRILPRRSWLQLPGAIRRPRHHARRFCEEHAEAAAALTDYTPK